eukprot:9221390-Pyramimonas_sp.AAC.1
MRRGWSVTVAAMHDGRPKHGRRGISRRHRGCAGGGPSARPLCTTAVQNMAGVAFLDATKECAGGGPQRGRYARRSPRA